MPLSEKKQSEAPSALQKKARRAHEGDGKVDCAGW